MPIVKNVLVLRVSYVVPKLPSLDEWDLHKGTQKGRNVYNESEDSSTRFLCAWSIVMIRAEPSIADRCRPRAPSGERTVGNLRGLCRHGRHVSLFQTAESIKVIPKWSRFLSQTFLNQRNFFVHNEQSSDSFFLFTTFTSFFKVIQTSFKWLENCKITIWECFGKSFFEKKSWNKLEKTVMWKLEDES